MKKIVGFLLIFVVCFSMISSALPSDTAIASTRSEVQARMVQTLYGGNGGRISCDFDGYTTTYGRHEGIDFANYSGATIYSLTSGKVIRAYNPSSGLSTLSIYDSSNDKSVIYLHATGFKVSTGDYVTQGQAIALEGAKGASAAHTHIEVRNGQQQYASKSVNDSVLDNPNPYTYWESIFGQIFAPSNPKISKNQYWYDLTDTVKITAYANNATRYYMSMFKDGERIKGQHVDGGKFIMSASEYGLGEYSVYFSCSNNAGTVDTEWLTFSVVGAAGYSDVWTSKPIYNLSETVAISVNTVCAKGQVIGIDKNGVERVITVECDSIYTIPASQLGVGKYSAYFTVYNGSGSIDTKRVKFSIAEPSDLGNLFYAQIKNPSTNMYVSNINGNVNGEPMDCDRSRTWRFERQGDGTYKIISSLDNGAMDVTDYGSAGNGTNVQINTSWDTTAQKFYIYEVYGAYYIKPICCDSYLDMDQNEPNNLSVWGGGADWPAQRFEIIKIHSDDVGVHKYVPSVEKEATCAVEGVQKYTCSVCQDSYKESIKKKEHRYSDKWIVDIEPTYTLEGSKSRHCANCDARVDIITIPKLEQVIKGDVNGDEKINMKDYALFQQYLSDWDVAIQTDAADVNADGKLNMKDLALLEQYLSDWDVILK